MSRSLSTHIFFFHLETLPDYVVLSFPMLSFPVTEKLITLLAGVSKATLSKLQFVKNTATRILTRQGIISLLFWNLYTAWLPVRFHVDFKIVMLTYV